LAPNIRVCGIAPGLTLASGDQTEAEFRRAGTKNLLARPNGPEEIVAAVRYILQSRLLDGQILVVDGGQTLMRLPRAVAFLDD